MTADRGCRSIYSLSKVLLDIKFNLQQSEILTSLDNQIMVDTYSIHRPLYIYNLVRIGECRKKRSFYTVKRPRNQLTKMLMLVEGDTHSYEAFSLQFLIRQKKDSDC